MMIKRYEIDDDMVAFVDKLNVNDGDTLILNIKTDDEGYPFQDLDIIVKMFNNLKNCFEDKDIRLIALFDKFCLEGIFSINSALEDLEELKARIEETIEEVKRLREPDSEIS